LLKAKSREVVCPQHAVSKAILRGIISHPDDCIPLVEKDLYKREPHIVVEQEPEGGERRFRAYYRYPEWGFIAYIILINSQIRLKTVYKTSKKIQKKAYRLTKRVGPQRKQL
jgi:hypothetical protein